MSKIEMCRKCAAVMREVDSVRKLFECSTCNSTFVRFDDGGSGKFFPADRTTGRILGDDGISRRDWIYASDGRPADQDESAGGHQVKSGSSNNRTEPDHESATEKVEEAIREMARNAYEASKLCDFDRPESVAAFQQCISATIERVCIERGISLV